MKTFKSLILALAVSFLLAACGGGDTPGAVVEKYFKAAQVADFEAAKKCVTKEIAAKFDDRVSMLDEDDIEEIKERNSNTVLKVISTEIEGDVATVFFEEIRDGETREQSLPLLKEDGKWKISRFY